MISDRSSKWNDDQREVALALNGITLEGTLTVPRDAKGLVLFAHGSGSSRHSPRNRLVAQILHRRQLGTLLFDLLTRQEESIDQYNAALRFDIPFLAKRLVGATGWLMNSDYAPGLPLGYFGASTGAGAALVAAAELPGVVSAIVSRGGRPDLAGSALGLVRAATLLIVGGEDKSVVAMNREALDHLKCQEKKLLIVPGATHLFEEPGALEEVARAASEWFGRHLIAAEKSPTFQVPGKANAHHF